MTARASVTLASTSTADDNGLTALHDLAAAAGDIEYRVIGGQMVRLLRHVYADPGIPRVSADADAGIDVSVASSGAFHEALTRQGYTPDSGNRYVRGDLAVDLLVPASGTSRTKELGGRAFDAAPGLTLALAAAHIEVEVTARMQAGNTMNFTVPVPDVEAAFVMKVLNRQVRDSDNDLDDITTLIEIVHTDPAYLATPWRMDDPTVVQRGTRGDAAAVVRRLIDSPALPARTRALLREHVALP
ncbi:hypothetical protein ACT17_22710 [Mycolicibacterium conceptionense]|uniref:Uncharacterized protein n=1 Tax=Mycolicibacterium conceptionense TaxID=451644 RepID=A0A0J8U376_9MYCO|nr:hypothetical protein [Mycolicibacterium conceptionense]KMV15993.1 hypothetical protein ACT17_22710 [Mycolicibacterium conceptionense]